MDYRQFPAIASWVDDMIGRWDRILLEGIGAIGSFVKSPEVHIQEANDVRLFILPLKWQGSMVDEVDQLPIGAQILDLVPIAAGLARNPLVTSAMFSMSMPGCELIPHIDNESHIGDVWRLHLGLSCPADCALTIGDEIRQWRDGEVLMFDSARVVHSAYNRSASPRMILILDFDRKALLAAS